jgi:hypothetical protein
MRYKSFFMALVALAFANCAIAGENASLKAAPYSKLSKKYKSTEEENGLKVGLKTENPVLGHFNLDLLFWKAQGNNWLYAFDNTLASDLHTNFVRGDAEWAPGMRLEVGFWLPFDWNVAAVYTYYHVDKKDKDHGDHISIVNDTVSATHFFDPVSSRTRINYNVFTLDFASHFRWAKNFSIKPTLSVEVASIKYSYNNKYYLAGETYHITKFWDEFTGGGPRFGFDAAYRFGWTNLDIIGAFFASLVYGSAEVRSSDKDPTREPYVYQYYKDDRGELKCHLQVSIGLKWKYDFDHNTKVFNIYSYWENNYWAELGQGVVNNIWPKESLIMSGLNFGFGFEY